MRFVVEGGVALKGRVKTYGAKNSVFKLMLAAALADGVSTIENLCLIRNVFVVKEIIESLGGAVFIDAQTKTATIDATAVKNAEVPEGLGRESRASSMIIPVLLHRFGKARVPFPGGDNIGARSLDRHFAGLEALGVEVSEKDGFIEAKVDGRLQAADYTFAKNTHTGTETLLLAACKAEGTTTLRNAAAEPEVDDLIAFLNLMGANIKRVAERTIVISGVDCFKGAKFAAMADRNEVVTFATAALATGGDVFVVGADPKYLKAFLEKVAEIGGGVEVKDEGVRFFWHKPLSANNVETQPYPGFMTDWQAIWVTLMTQAQGESIVHERVYESRFGYLENLKKMGSNIELFNPTVENPEAFYNFNLADVKADSFHAVRIKGPTKLRGTNLTIEDIRAGATLTLASLIAEGHSSLENVDLIERGYENLDGRLRELGAKIYKTD